MSGCIHVVFTIHLEQEAFQRGSQLKKINIIGNRADLHVFSLLNTVPMKAKRGIHRRSRR